MSAALEGFDIKQISVNEQGKVILLLNHKTFDEDGFEVSSNIEKLVFQKNDDVLEHSEIVQKICRDAWSVIITDETLTAKTQEQD